MSKIPISKIYFSHSFSEDYLEYYFQSKEQTKNLENENENPKNEERWRNFDPPKLSPFFQCHLDYFQEKVKHKTKIDLCFLPNYNVLVIGKRATNPQNITLCHAEECPCREFQKLSINQQNQLLKDKNVKLGTFTRIGVAVLISNEKDQILITRRAPHMRTFPNTWVIPGGHLDFGEDLETAGIREISEETGVLLSKNDVSILGIYESVFPIILKNGIPTHHHSVIYLTAKVKSEKCSLKIDPNEVDAAAWVHFKILQKSLKDDKSLKDNFEGLVFNPHSKKFEETKFSLKNLAAFKDENGNFPNERLSTGTRFIISEWLQQFE